MIDVLGGIGLFLLGMMLMTEGLQDAAAERLRALLHRVTGHPLKGTATGAGITLVVQSSTATTLATIGFVSAGLLTFQQALAVVVGANIGTTSTGWLVALLGFKVQVATFALPLVAVGALLRMLGRGRVRPIGLALAGLGLIFVGIDALQHGMAGLADHVDLGGIDGESVPSRLLLVGAGLAMTVVMQSSSAAVATTLAAVHSDAIGLPAAAALIVGQNVGTTVTAVVASIGATVPARRTAAAHVLFNVITAAIVFVLLPLVPRIAEAVGLEDDPALMLAAFHTAFSLLGALLVLPFLGPFARLVTRVVPERRPSFTRNLDTTVAAVPPVAVHAARRAALAVAGATFEVASRALLHGQEPRSADMAQEREALAETRRFLAGVRSSSTDGDDTYARHLSVLHALDHGERLAAALVEQRPRAGVHDDPDIREAAEELGEALAEAARWCASVADGGGEEPTPRDDLERISRALAERRRTYRAAMLARTARGECSPDEAVLRMDAMYQVDRIGYHAWRSMHHLALRPEPLADAGDVPEASLMSSAP